MSDRLALAHVIEDAGIPREKAEAVATAIARFVEGSAATKADVQASESAVRSDIAKQDVAIERLRSSVREMESRLLTRLGGIVAAGVAVIVALQHVWPPH
jgi:hypothetical protein